MSKLLFKYRKASGDYNYKGVAADNFECGLALDEEAPHLSCIKLVIDNKIYDCDELYIDGMQVFAKELSEYRAGEKENK